MSKDKSKQPSPGKGSGRKGGFIGESKADIDKLRKGAEAPLRPPPKEGNKKEK